MQQIAIYPGTFDPITYGHLHIIHRSSQLFDQLIVAIAADTTKNTVFTAQERLSLAKQIVHDKPNINVILFKGLLASFAKQQQATLIIRALRCGADFNHEYQLACHNRALYDQLETLFLIPEPQYAYIHAGMVREIASHQGRISHLVHPLVEQAIITKQQG